MIERTGDIWDALNDSDNIILVTTNATIKTDGSLVMGAGIAKEAAKRFPGIAHKFGRYLLENFEEEDGTIADYHIIINSPVGAIQTKRYWGDKSPLELVKRSIAILYQVASVRSYEKLLHMTRPGCGLGGLDWEGQVEPLCRNLPDNVVIWSKE